MQGRVAPRPCGNAGDWPSLEDTGSQARPAGLEPATSGLEVRRSIQAELRAHVILFCAPVALLVEPVVQQVGIGKEYSHE